MPSSIMLRKNRTKAAPSTLVIYGASVYSWYYCYVMSRNNNDNECSLFNQMVSIKKLPTKKSSLYNSVSNLSVWKSCAWNK